MFNAAPYPAENFAMKNSVKNLTIRDYFAAKALPQCLSRSQGMYLHMEFADRAKIIADEAYMLADAMLKAREQ